MRDGHYLLIADGCPSCKAVAQLKAEVQLPCNNGALCMLQIMFIDREYFMHCKAMSLSDVPTLGAAILRWTARWWIHGGTHQLRGCPSVFVIRGQFLDARIKTLSMICCNVTISWLVPSLHTSFTKSSTRLQVRNETVLHTLERMSTDCSCEKSLEMSHVHNDVLYISHPEEFS